MGSGGAQPGKTFFTNLEGAHREFQGKLGIVAAGGMGVYVFRDVMGSPFLSRASKVILRPFSRDQIKELARPFEENGCPLSDSCLDLLILLSGGNPALVTYGLQQLWDSSEQINENAVGNIFTRFKDEKDGFVHSIQRHLNNTNYSTVPHRIWTEVNSRPGPFSLEHLKAICARASER